MIDLLAVVEAVAGAVVWTIGDNDVVALWEQHFDFDFDSSRDVVVAVADCAA